MDSKAIKELEILHEISKNERINQRFLSTKLGMATGLVNIYLKRLAQKGYVKITGVRPHRLKYLVTPAGIAEKARLTYEFALVSYKYFKSAVDDIRNELATIAAADSASVIVYGSGELGELCLQIIKEFEIEVMGVVDDALEGRKFQGYPIIHSDLLRNIKFDTLVVAKIDSHAEIQELLNSAGIEREKVCWLIDGHSQSAR